MFLLQSFREAILSTWYAHRGLILATGATVAGAICFAAFNIQSGFGLVVDLAFTIVVALVGLPLLALAISSVLALLRLLPRLLTGFILAAGVLISSLWAGAPALVRAAIPTVLLLVECSLGAAILSILRARRSNASLTRRIVAWSVLGVSIVANLALIRFVQQDGIDEELLQIKQKQNFLPPVLSVGDPSQPGRYAVKTLYYGSGNSLRRREFGPSVAIRTRTVDASGFFKDFDGWRARLRKFYWGFGMEALPLNARVFYPDGPGPFPLVLIVHGNHVLSVASDAGYAYLGELLASRGFIAVSVDENFLNVGLFHDPPKQQPVRGWLLLEHLRLWDEWSKDTTNPFYGKVDLSRIALAGHSRGGEAAATAALFNRLSYYPDDANIRFNYGYAIKSVIAIAPVDGQYKPAEQWRMLQDVNYLTLQGANDSDVSSFMGSRQYDHVHFSGSVPAFKSELYIYRANHGQFNTMWGRADTGWLARWFLDLRPLLTGDEQRQIAKVYISGFLETTLRGNVEMQALFRDYRRGRQWLPDTLYENRFEDQNYRTVCNFSEDADVTTTTAAYGRISASGLTVWREGKIPFRSNSREYNGVFLGWNWQKQKSAPKPAPSYSVDLPPAGESTSLAISVAATDDDAPDPQNKNSKPNEDVEEKDGTTNFTVEATSTNCARAQVSANAFMLLLPPLHVQFTKLERLDREIYGTSAEPAFQTIEIPFSAFARANPMFDPHAVKRITLIFDKTPSRVIIVSGIGLEKE